MPYLIERESYGRKETVIDLPRFAADLARELSGALEAHSEEHIDGDQEHILIAGLTLSVHANRYDSKGKAHISAVVRDIPPGDRPYNDGRGTYTMPEAYVSVPRPLAVIAKDIKRRVVDAAATPLANIHGYAAKREQERQGVAHVAGQLCAAVPEMRERQNGSGNDNHSRTLDWAGAISVYLTVRAYSDGAVSIDRIGNVSLAAFVEIAGVLRRHAKNPAADSKIA